MSYLTAEVVLFMHKTEFSHESGTTSLYIGIYKSMRIYPVAMFVTWFPALIYSFVGIVFGDVNFSVAEPFMHWRRSMGPF